MADKTSTKDKDLSYETPMVSDELYVMAAGYGGGSGGGGIGNGGGSPGGGTPGGGDGGGGGGGKPDDTPGGGGNGGRPGEESVGNNLSFPAIFFDAGAPTLRGTMGDFLFTTPTTLAEKPGYVYFAQGVSGNTWQAGNYTTDGSIVVDYVDIGDALESSPVKTGTNVRLELTLYQDLIYPDDGETVPSAAMTAFAMELLGGAKGEGKPDKVGPTESQGARLPAELWDEPPYDSTTADTLPDEGTTTYESSFASIYAADTLGGEGETVNSYMSMTVQKVTGVTAETDLAKLSWVDGQWEASAGNPDVSVGENLANTAFGPELNIGGKYIMGASGKPFKFTSDGDYLITFALDWDAPVSFDADTAVRNDSEPDTLGFQPGDAAGRTTWVIADPMGGEQDTHNGLLVMLVGVPSSPDTGGDEAA